MLKFFFWGICLFSCSIGYALYNANPSEPELIEEGFLLNYCDDFLMGKAGYQGDFVFNRKLRAYKGAIGRMDEFYSMFNQAVLTANIKGQYEIYGSLGTMTAKFSHRPHIDHKQRIYETRDHFTWGAGARAELAHWNGAILGANGGYQYSRPHVKWITVNGEAFKSQAFLNYHEWQVGLGVSYKIDCMVPYISGTYSRVGARVENIGKEILPHSHFKLRSRQNWGMALGCSLATDRLFDLNVEVRLFSEQALTLAGNLKF